MEISEEFQAQLRAQHNPEGSEIRKAQYRMLELLKAYDKICRENNLSYWLAGGTMLGAARHGGFIPWDDDVDVYMPRKDAMQLKNIMGGGNSRWIYGAPEYNDRPQLSEFFMVYPQRC